MAKVSTPSAESVLANFDENQVLELVQELMAIPGKSGQEADVLAFVKETLLTAGIPKNAIEVDNAQSLIAGGGNTGSLIVKLPGTRRGPRRLLMAHLDTVPLCVGCQPTRQDDLIKSANPATALGADNRAGVAVLVSAAQALFQHKIPHPPVTLFFPIQEEVGLLGARHVDLEALGQPKLCFNWDGGSPEMVCIGATGAYHLDIDIEGVASHAGVHPELGVSAVAIAGMAIAELQANGLHGLIRKGKKSGTSNLGAIHGGEATNVVTPQVTVRGEVRSHDPAFRERLVKKFRKAFERAVKQVRSATGQKGSLKFEATLKYESFRLEETEPSVETAKAAIAALGLTPQTRISNGGLDANWLSARGLPTVTLGCGQQDVHTVKESLHIPSFISGCKVGLLLASGAV